MRELTQYKSEPVTFFMTDSTDLTAGLTGITPAVTVSNTGSAFAASDNAATEVSGGMYRYVLSVSETSIAGALDLYVTGAGAVSFPIQCWVKAEPDGTACEVVGSPTTTSIPVTGLLAGTDNDHWNDAFLRFTSGANAGQVKQITGSSESAGVTTLLTNAFTAAPTTGDYAAIIAE